MRLTCPTCETAYEVPSGQLPETGRHVQCSTCHTRWFARPTPEPEPSEEQIIYRLETRTTRPAASTAKPAAAERADDRPPQPIPEAEPQPVEDFVWEGAPAGPIRPATPAPRVAPAPVPPEPRKASPIAPPSPAAPPEVITPPAPPPAPAPLPTSRRHGELAPPPPPRPSELPPRFGHEEAPEPEVSLPDGQRVGHHPLRLEIPGTTAENGWDREGRLPLPSRFGRGVVVALILFTAALALYRFDQEIIAAAPALAPAVDAYVGAIDQAREALASLAPDRRSP